jgi:hypothetical protein
VKSKQGFTRKLFQDFVAIRFGHGQFLDLEFASAALRC